MPLWILACSRRLLLAMAATLCAATAESKPAKAPGVGWVAAWTAAAQGPYPAGFQSAQPEMSFALPSADRGASNQSFRLILRPDVWGRQARVRLSNAFGGKPVTFDDVEIGLQTSGAVIVARTNRSVTFAGKSSATVPAGQSLVSDPVALPWVKDPNDPMLANRKLAVSFHVVGDSGPITWHAMALTTSYISGPGAGSHTQEDGDFNFPYSTTSWYFLDEVEMTVPGAQTIVAFGDSITDGDGSTLNGDDRWSDVFSRRVHAALGARFSVVNEGISGNMVLGPADRAAAPFPGGPSAAERLERDVISLPNVTKVIWLEGINDFGNAGAGVDKVEDGARDLIKRLRERLPGVKIYMGMLTSALNSPDGAYGSTGVDGKRRAYNDFIRKAGIFDGIIDFDGATIDAKTGELKAEFQPNSTTGGPGDKFHPNRAGYSAMGNAIGFATIFGLHEVRR
jgi:lysophospholipase L1-like esterase